MAKSNESEEQISGALKRAEQVIPLKDFCRKLGISNTIFYQWHSKYYAAAVHEISERRDHRHAEL